MSVAPEEYPPETYVPELTIVPDQPRTPRQEWYDQFAAFTTYADLSPETITAETRKAFANHTLGYITEHVHFKQPDRPHLPKGMVEKRAETFYKKYLPLAPVPNGDKIVQTFYNRFCDQNMSLVRAYSPKFLELRLALRLQMDLQKDGHEMASKSVGELLVAYGMSLHTLEGLQNSARWYIGDGQTEQS